MTLEQAIFAIIAIPLFCYLIVQFIYFIKDISK